MIDVPYRLPLVVFTSCSRHTLTHRRPRVTYRAAGWDGRAKWRQPPLTLDEARELVSRPENRMGVESIREALDPKTTLAPASAPASALAPR